MAIKLPSKNVKVSNEITPSVVKETLIEPSCQNMEIPPFNHPLVKNLTQEEKLKLVLSTPELWIKNFIRIVDKKGNVIPFELNDQQKDFMQKKGKQNIILKARQLGFSTLTCALALYHACTKPNTHCLLVSYSQDSASALFDKLKTMYDTIPDAMKPALYAKNKKELAMKNGSKVICSTAGMKDIGRGMTITFCHLSEFAFWRDNADALLLGLEQAMTPTGTLVIESTANGMNYFSELWNNINTYNKMFYSWWEDRSMFKDEWDLFEKIYLAQHNNKMPNDWDDYESTLLQQGASPKQLMWRRVKIQNMGMEGTIKFKQEFPSSPMEAFQTTGHSLFDNEQITAMAMSVREPLSFDDIKPFMDEEINWQKETWQRFPKELGEVLKSKELLMWDTVKERNKYYIGADFSEGVGRDETYFVIMNFNCDVVACFSTNHRTPRDCADMLYHLAKYYNNAYIVVERASSGPTAIERLRNELGYMNMHKHKMMDERNKKRSQIGFVTTQKSKIQIINDLRQWFNEGEIQTDDTKLLKQMSTFIVTEEGKMQASGNNHDDAVMAAALCLHGLKTGIWYG